jgi:hypothetical protein
MEAQERGAANTPSLPRTTSQTLAEYLTFSWGSSSSQLDPNTFSTILTIQRLHQIARHIMTDKLSEKLIINQVDLNGKRVLMR